MAILAKFSLTKLANLKETFDNKMVFRLINLINVNYELIL
jgi:hypothetical protein